MFSTRHTIVGLVICGLILTACSGPGETSIGSFDGLPVIHGSGAALGASLSGQIVVNDQGCWALQSDGSLRALIIVWPDGSRWADSTRQAVKLQTGGVVSKGTHVTGSGGEMTDVERSSVKISGDVPCLRGSKVSYVVFDESPTMAPVSTPAN
jgi:hypothetical protein